MGKPKMYGMNTPYISNKGSRQKAPWQGAHKKIKPPTENTCTSCGEIIPEGRQVCPICEHKAMAKE